METVVQTFLIQLGCYIGLSVFIIMSISFLFRGFFWKFLKVKTSMGKYVLIKSKGTMRDIFMVGNIKDGFLLFEDKKEDNKKYTAKISIEKNYNAVYRCLGINWIDIDEDKSAILKPNYEGVTGFDTKKYSDLMTRCLQSPQLTTGYEKIILFLIGIVGLLLLANLYMTFLDYSKAQELIKLVPTVCKATIIGNSGVI